MGPDYFERLLAKFDADPSLGIASGSAFEFRRGTWEQRYVTGSLSGVPPARIGGSACSAAAARAARGVGWRRRVQGERAGLGTIAFEELQFRHHRREGERDGTGLARARESRQAAHYLGYRPWYLPLRALWNARRDPAALGMIWGYAVAALTRAERNEDVEARAYLRRQQSPRNLRHRALEARGRREQPEPRDGGPHDGRRAARLLVGRAFATDARA